MQDWPLNGVLLLLVLVFYSKVFLLFVVIFVSYIWSWFISRVKFLLIISLWSKIQIQGQLYLLKSWMKRIPVKNPGVCINTTLNALLVSVVSIKMYYFLYIYLSLMMWSFNFRKMKIKQFLLIFWCVNVMTTNQTSFC